jgi:DNA-3-methyladenine glycosylase II
MTPNPYAAAEAHLAAADPALARIIATYGPCTLERDPRLFRTLVSAIVNQQLSGKAAATILRRFIALLPNEEVTPEGILALTPEQMRAAGLSGAKGRYMHDLAAKVAEGVVNLERIDQESDEAVIAELTQVHGIGRWTAEMFLIFSLGRLDVLPVDDLGFRTGVMRAYGLPALPGKADLVARAVPWRPYASIATWYLWRSLENSPFPEAARG